MTPLHVEHAAAVAISNRLFAVDEAAWRDLLAVAHRLDVTLLALVYHRLREVRDDVAREAFERRVSIGEVARERLAAVRNSKPTIPTVRFPREKVASRSVFAPADENGGSK